MAKRRYSEPFKIVKLIPVRDSTGGVSQHSSEVELLSGLASVNDSLKARNNLDVVVKLDNSVSFEFFCPADFQIDLSMKVIWRNKNLNIQSFRTLPDVRKIQLVCSYEG